MPKGISEDRRSSKITKASPTRKRLPSTGRDPVSVGGVTYQLRYVRCGKPRCRRWHGPYWYSYRKVGGRVVCRYIGKREPEWSKLAAAIAE
jgi:hypothetical protein